MQHHPTADPTVSVVLAEWPEWSGTVWVHSWHPLCSLLDSLTVCSDFQGHSFFRIIITFYLSFIIVIISEQGPFFDSDTVPPKAAVGAELCLRTRSCVWVLLLSQCSVNLAAASPWDLPCIWGPEVLQNIWGKSLTSDTAVTQELSWLLQYLTWIQL